MTTENKSDLAALLRDYAAKQRSLHGTCPPGDNLFDDAASAIQSLIRERDEARASNEALMRERTKLIETKREQLAAVVAEVLKLRALIDEVFDEYDAETKKLPLGATDRNNGASAYNWRRSVVDELRKLVARRTLENTNG